MPGSDKPILMVRLGAMGDIIHALPAATSLKLSFPDRRLVWVAARKWMPLFEGNPHLDEVVSFERRSVAELAATWKRLRSIHPGITIDFQGLLQSAMAGRLTKPDEFIGLDRHLAREKAASLFYTKTVDAAGPHRVERCLQLASAAGADILIEEAWLPEGRAEGELPDSPFVLANPFAGWVSKQWPIECYEELGRKLCERGLTLVVNVPETRSGEVRGSKYLQVHSSSISGLIYATRRAASVVGVDSGPLHMAAALKKPGVAIYGPTDPLQTGPFKSRIVTLRAETTTSYKRENEIHPSMRAITPERVMDALMESMCDALHLS